jgi:hypothetical protein
LERTVKPARLQAAAIWAITVWPALNFMAVNWEQVAIHRVGALLGILLSTVVAGIVGHLMHRFAVRSGRGGFFVVVWLELVCLFFGYAAIRDGSRWVFEACGLPIPPFTGFIAVSVLVLSVTAWFRKSENLQFAALTFCLVAAGVSVLMLTMAALRFDAPPPEGTATNVARSSTANGVRGPNVYYIILDSYPGLRGLRTASGIDNSAFIARMAARGFVDRSTERSNYLKTQQELGSIFGLDYAQTEDPRTWKDPRVLYPRMFDYDAPPPLVARFKDAGYAAWHSASVWDDCPRKHFNCLGETMFMKLDQMTQAFFAPTPLGRPLLYVLGRRHDALVSIVRDLPRLTSSARPVFVFGHHMSPHPPFLFDRNCERYPVRRESLDTWNPTPEGHQGFFEALTCVNLEVERTVDAILRIDPKAFIVLQGDHGSAFAMDWAKPISEWTEASIEERVSYLNLIRAPVDCARWLDRPLGQINTARFVIGCVEQRRPDYLEERTYLSSYAEGPDGDVVRQWGH